MVCFRRDWWRVVDEWVAALMAGFLPAMLARGCLDVLVVQSTGSFFHRAEAPAAPRSISASTFRVRASLLPEKTQQALHGGSIVQRLRRLGFRHKPTEWRRFFCSNCFSGMLCIRQGWQP